MNSFLYYSISSNLTEDEIIEVDSQVDKSREAVYLFFRELPSNSKRRAKQICLYVTFVVAISQPLTPYAYTVMVPLPPPIERLSPIEQDIIIGHKNSYPQITPFIEPKTHKTILTDNRIEDLNIIVNKLENGSITLDEAILKLRAGGGDLSPLTKILIRIVLVWVMQKNAGTAEAFTKPSFGHLSKVGPTPRIAPKLQENPIDRNNPLQGSCKSSNHPSMDKFANSLSLEYSEFQNKYYSESLPKRFDTNNYSTKEFKELAQDPRSSDNKFDRVSIDEARTVVQAKLEKVIIKPTRPDTETAKRVDLDFRVKGPAPFTHIDVKNPVGSEILKKQGQAISLEDMSYRIGQKIVAQKQRFVGLEDGPLGPENVGHIVDLCYVPSSEKAIVKQNVLQGARDKGSDAGIIFLNDT